MIVTCKPGSRREAGQADGPSRRPQWSPGQPGPVLGPGGPSGAVWPLGTVPVHPCAPCPCAQRTALPGSFLWRLRTPPPMAFHLRARTPPSPASPLTLPNTPAALTVPLAQASAPSVHTVLPTAPRLHQPLPEHSRPWGALLSGLLGSPAHEWGSRGSSPAPTELPGRRCPAGPTASDPAPWSYATRRGRHRPETRPQPQPGLSSCTHCATECVSRRHKTTSCILQRLCLHAVRAPVSLGDTGLRSNRLSPPLLQPAPPTRTLAS